MKAYEEVSAALEQHSGDEASLSSALARQSALSAEVEKLGGWDYDYSRVGEPGICFDNELCFRAWQNGYRVGYSFVPFKGAPGTMCPFLMRSM